MSFGDVIRLAQSPYTYPRGIGGDSTTIWHSDTSQDRIYELSTTDLSVIRSVSAYGSGPLGIGGNANVIWHNEFSPVGAPPYNQVYELSIIDFSSIRNANAPGTNAVRDIGGDENTIWFCQYLMSGGLHELSITDFSSIRTGNAFSWAATGIGGNANVIWHCDDSQNRTYELSTSDFSSIRYASSPSSSPGGIGGNTSVIWHSDCSSDKIYELDPAMPGIEVGDTVLLIPNHGDIYDRACIKGGNISPGDTVRLYPLKNSPKAAIKESWSSGDKIFF